MALKDIFKRSIAEVATIPIDYKPSISFENNSVNNLTEQFKGEIEQDNLTFPIELGEKHPFNFQTLEALYEKFGFFTAVVDKYIDFVVGPGFYIECKDARAKEIVEKFMKDVNFDTILRAWTKEMLIKGNGFLEIGGSKKEGVKGLKVLDADYMYVVRDKKGKILGYNQYTGAFKTFTKEKKIPFKTNQIAFSPFNIVGDKAYGLGIGYPAMGLIDSWLSMNSDEHKIMKRKANAPLHAQLGIIDGDTKIIPKPEDVKALGKDIENLSNKTEWTTDPLVNFKVVDFPNFGEKFSLTKESDLEMLIYAFQIPAVLLGKANIAEGLARVQMEAFQRRIQSIQAELEKIIENQIIKRVLEANGLAADVEFEWGTPSVMEIEGRMKLISEMMKSATVSGAMNIMLEDEMINLLKLDKDEWEKLKLEYEEKEEEERKRLEAQPQPIVPGQNAKFPQKVAPKKEQPKQPKPIPVKQSEDSLKKIEESRLEELSKFMNKMQEDIDKNTQKNVEGIKSVLEKELQDIKDNINDKSDKQEEELQKMHETLKQLEKTKRVVLKKKSIVPEAAKLEDIKKEKLIVKIKRTKENQNYEHEKDCPHCTEKWEDVNDISEWLNFSYAKYLGYIVAALKTFEFGQLKAINEIELEAGYLSSTQVNKLRSVLDEGFTKGAGMKEMAKLVDAKVGIKDLYKMTAEGDIKLGASGLPILSKSADKRAIGIVRTEVTRMANKGAIEYYKKNKIKQIKWVASFGERTCEQCEALDGIIYEIGAQPEIPLHPMCRCTLSPVVELK